MLFGHKLLVSGRCSAVAFGTFCNEVRRLSLFDCISFFIYYFFILHLFSYRLFLPFTSQPDGNAVISGYIFNLRWEPERPSSTPGPRTTPAPGTWTGPSCPCTRGGRTRGERGRLRSTMTPSPNGPRTRSSSSGH